MIRALSTQSTLAAALLMAAAPLALAGNGGSWTAKVGAPPHADVQPFEHAKLSLTQAITEAHKEMRGKTLEARFEVWKGKPAYLIRTYSAHQVWESRIDANTGQPMSQPQAVAASQLSPRVKSDVAALSDAQTNLTQAISKAEQQEGGKVIMARVKASPNGNAAYDLDLVKQGQLHTAMIDTQSGQLR